ncbi:unnamed protein product, partial [Pocillopora meandrina]
ITIIINIVTCPFTVLLNVLMIIALKTRPSVRTNSNILLACLAVTVKKFSYFYFDFMIVFSTASSVHLRLITFQRLIAIKFTMQYSNKIANNNLKVAVAAIWVNAF